MKVLGYALLFAVAFSSTASALVEAPFSDERLIDMTAGKEVGELTMEITAVKTDVELPRVRLRSTAGDITSTMMLDLPTRDYEAHLIQKGRGVIFTHRDSKSRIVLVRTRYTGEKDFIWMSAHTSKRGAEIGGSTSVSYVQIHDAVQLSSMLARIVP